MADLGPPIAYQALPEGVPVYDRGATRIGVVEQVLADEPVDIFHGLVVHTEPLPGKHVVADADQIAELRERGVLLSVLADDLHEPRRYATAGEDTEKPADGPLRAGLRRLVDRLRGRH
jgi:uncharacterized protein YrrD